MQLYWFLWYHNLVIAGLILRVLYALLRRKFLVYPTLDDLRKRHSYQDRADDFSKHIVVRLASPPATRVKDVWNGIKRRMQKEDGTDNKAKEALGLAVLPPQITVEGVTEDVDTTGVRTEDVPLAESDYAGPLLDLANQIADIHERIRK